MASEAESASAPQAYLDVTRSATRLEFLCTSPLKRFFSLDARLAGNIAVSRGPVESGVPTSRVEVPVSVGGQRQVVAFVHRRADGEQKGTVLEAWQQVDNEGRQHLRFVIGDERERAWYEVTVPPGLDLLDFEPIERARAAQKVPSLGQLGGLMRGAIAAESTARGVFARLCHDCPEPEAEAMLEAWREEGAPPLWGHDAVAALAEVNGLRVSVGALAGAALYAEAASGAITAEQFERLSKGDRVHALSLYAVEGLATALRLPFLPLQLGSGGRISWDLLLQLSPGGLVQRSSDGGWRFVSPTDVPDDSPAGDVLVLAPVVPRLGERELALFLAAGRPLLACYQSDLDRRRIWLRLEREARGDFVEDFRTFRFQGSVMGELRDAAACPDDAPRVFKDHRGSAHYYGPDETPDPAQVTPSGLAVHIFMAPDVPERLTEIGADRLLAGAPEGAEARRLEQLQRALGSAVALYPAETITDRVRARVTAPDILATLEKVVDASTVEHLAKAWLGDDAGVDVRPLGGLAEALDDELLLEYAALSLVQALCVSDLTTVKGFRKGFKALPLRALLRDHLLHVLDHRSGRVKAAACRLLATRGCIASANEQSLVEYELQRRLDDPETEVGDAAAVALARIALSGELELPHAWQVRVPDHLQARAEAAALRTGAIQAVAAEWTELRRRLDGALGVTHDDKGPPPKALMALAEWLHELRQVIASLPVVQGRLIVTRPGVLDAVGVRVLRMIRAYATERKVPMAALVAEGANAWVKWVAQRDASEGRGGAEAEEDEAGIEVFGAAAACTPHPLWAVDGARISPVAMAVLRRVAEGGIEAVQIARLPLSTRSVMRLPAGLYTQLYDASSASFKGLLQTWLERGVDDATADEMKLLRLIVAAVPKPFVAARTAAPVAVAAPPPPSRAPVGEMTVEAQPETHRARARRLLEVMGLPASAELPVLYLLAAAGTHEELDQRLSRKVAASSK